MAALASSKSVDTTIALHEEKAQPGDSGADQNAPNAEAASEGSEHQAASVVLAIPKSGDHLYQRRSMTLDRNADRGPTEVAMVNGKPRRSIPSELHLSSQTGQASTAHVDGHIPLPLASPVTITAASLTALSLSSHSEPPSPRTPTAGGFGSTASSSSPFSTSTSRPLSLISSVSVSTLSVPRNNFQLPSSSSSSTSTTALGFSAAAAAAATIASSSSSSSSTFSPSSSSSSSSKGAVVPSATDTLPTAASTDEQKSVTSPREQNSPRPYSSMSPPEALLSHHTYQQQPHPSQKTAAGTRPSRRQTIQSDYRQLHGHAAASAAGKIGGAGSGVRRARGHARQAGPEAGLGGGGGRSTGALSDSETLGATCAAGEGSGSDLRIGSEVQQDHTSGTTTTTTTTSSSSHHSNINTNTNNTTTTKTGTSAQLRVNLYSLVTRGYLPANITVAFREHCATITPHGTLVPIVPPHIQHHLQDEENKEGAAASGSVTLYPWLQQEYETPSAWATAMVKGARTGKVAVNGWSAIKVPLHQDPSLVKMYGGQGIHEVSLDVLRKKFLADLAGSVGEEIGEQTGATASGSAASPTSSSKSASGSLSKASARQIAKELAIDGRKRKRQIGKGGGAGSSGAADASGLWILTSKLDTLAGQRQSQSHHHQPHQQHQGQHQGQHQNHPRGQGARVRGGGSRRPIKRSMPDYVLQGEDSVEDRQSRLEAAGTLFAMQDHYVSHRGGEAGYSLKGHSAHRSSDKAGGLGSRTMSHRRIELQSVTKYLQAREARRAVSAHPIISVRRVTPLTIAQRRSRDICLVCKKTCQPSISTEAPTDTGATSGADSASMDICKSETPPLASANDIKLCTKCNSPAHEECITTLPALCDQENWVCPRCIHCTACERGLLERPPNKASHCDLKMTILNCSECREGVHLECQLELEPSLKAFVTAGSTCETLPEDFDWKCMACRACVECGYSCKHGAPSTGFKLEQQQEGTPSSPEPVQQVDGTMEDTEMAEVDSVDDKEGSRGRGRGPKQVQVDGWTNAYTICPGCTRLYEMGNICPLCCRLYPEDDYDTPMVFCDGCSFWVHVACDSGLAGNDYEELGKDSKQYFCPSCNPTPMPSPALSTSSSSSSSAYQHPGNSSSSGGGGRYGGGPPSSGNHPQLPSRIPQDWNRPSRYGVQQAANKRDDIFDLIMAAKEISDSESRAQSPSLMEVDGSEAAAAVAAAAAAGTDSLAEVQAAEALLTIFSGSNTPVCSTPYASYPPSPYEPHFNPFGSRPSGYPTLLESPAPPSSSSSSSSPYHQDSQQQQQQQQQQVFASPRSSYSNHGSDDYFSGQHRPSKRISYQHIGQELNHGTLLETPSSATSSSSPSIQYYPHAGVKREDAEYEHSQHHTHPHHNQHQHHHNHNHNLSQHHHHHHTHPQHQHGYSAGYHHTGHHQQHPQQPQHPQHHGYVSSSSRVGSSAATTPTTAYSTTTPVGGSFQSMANMYRPIQPNGSPSGVTSLDLESQSSRIEAPAKKGIRGGGSVPEEQQPRTETGTATKGIGLEEKSDMCCALCRTKRTPGALGGSWITVEQAMATQPQDKDKVMGGDEEVEGSQDRLPWRVHRECALWATGVTHEKDSDRYDHAASVIKLSQAATCSSCGQAGASIRCKASTTSHKGGRSYACAAIFHYPCVVRTATLVNSVSTHAVVVDEQERSILCRMHYREAYKTHDRWTIMPRFTSQQKHRALSLLAEGNSIENVRKQVRMSHTTVHRIRATSKENIPPCKPGPPAAASERTKKLLARKFATGQFTRLEQGQQLIHDVEGKDVGKACIKKYLRQQGVKAYVKQKKSPELKR
ncbi:hypothetical protein DFQ27_007213 [Actinomortierella ambigua]|uniref:PHD-type domain-containing protein n=1 Tax=Actinomortierella ambigua TaxID=1343610 RepID=A0A9P6UBU2_9FUNG|nr:hypothetical protein DFQ27_007213 [Actinomortierella ambigua]